MLAQRLRGLAKASRVLLYARTCSSASLQAAETPLPDVASKTGLIAKITEQHGDAKVVVHWKDNSVSRFPYIYLRDLCTCSKCINQDSLERLSDTVKDVPLDIRATNVEVSDDGGKLQLKWPDDHVTEFESDWLHGKRLLEKNERDESISSSTIARHGVKFWNRSDMQDNIPRFNFHDVIQDDSILFDWLEKLHSIGIALLEDVPGYTEPTSCERLAKRTGYIKSTHYGYVLLFYFSPKVTIKGKGGGVGEGIENLVFSSILTSC